MSTELFNNGVSIIKVFDTEELNFINSEFWNMVSTFPEYNQLSDPKTNLYQIGAFGAFGCPSSFHNLQVRKLRESLMKKAIPFFSEYLKLVPNGDKFNLEQLIDRSCKRTKGGTIGRETWHRDQAPSPVDESEEIIFGGWLNLDVDQTQMFSCVPATHNLVKGKSGFDKISKEEGLKYNKLRKIYEIPPGHWIVFNQNLIHEIKSGKIKNDSVRLYTGFRLTTSTSEFETRFNSKKDYVSKDKILNDQGIIYLPGGDRPPMYSSNHLSFHSIKLISWCEEQFKPVCIEEKNTPKLGKYKVVNRYMKSLTEYGFKKYPDYSEQELAILHPNNKWTIDDVVHTL